MTQNNYKQVNRFKKLVFLLMSLLIVDFTLSALNGSIGSYFQNHWLAISSASSLLLIAALKVSYFDFEGEHEIIDIRSGKIWKHLFSTTSVPRIEFPKEMLVSAHVKNFIFFKQLYFTIETMHGTKVIGGFCLSMISNKEVKQLLSQINKTGSEENRVIKLHPSHSAA